MVKAINMLMIVMACALLWTTLRNACDATVATIFLTTFVCLADVWSIWRTSTHSISLVYILAGTALFAAALRKGWSASNMIVMSAALGSGFNFLDFLITPPMMPMLLAFFVLLDSRRELGTLALTVVFAWFFGYSETWIAKWALAYFAMPESAGVAKDILSTIEFRTVGAFNGVDLVPLAATAKAFLRAVDRIEVVVPAIFVLAIAHYATTASRIDWRRALCCHARCSFRFCGLKHCPATRNNMSRRVPAVRSWPWRLSCRQSSWRCSAVRPCPTYGHIWEC
jgi:hypothetical protein